MQEAGIRIGLSHKARKLGSCTHLTAEECPQVAGNGGILRIRQAHPGQAATGLADRALRDVRLREKPVQND